MRFLFLPAIFLRNIPQIGARPGAVARCCSRVLRAGTVLCGILACWPLAAQELLPSTRFYQGDFYRERFDTKLPRVDLEPPTRLSDFQIDGKLEFSLRSYLELVLANNTDMQVQKLSVEVQRNAITRAFAPFDPVVTANFNATRSETPTDTALAGAVTLSQLSQPYGIRYLQTLESGTQYSAGFDGVRTTTNNSFATFNPNITGNFRLSFSQPLLRNRGLYINRLPIMVARSRYRQSQYNMQDQIMRLLNQAELAYWSVIEAREALKVQEQGLALQDALLKRSQRELELGAISALEIYRPQQSYATAEIQVTQARYRLQQAEDVLRRQISADLDPAFRNMPLVLTESTLPPQDDRPLDKEAHVETAYRMRPDLKSSLQALDIDDLNFQSAKNRIQPDLALTGTYNSAGRGGNSVTRTNVFVGDGRTSAITRIIPGGFGDTLGQVFGFDFPAYGFGLTLRLPLRDRAGTADLADATINKRLNSLRARSLEQQIRQEVLNAVTQVENSRASVRLAQVALDFSQKNVDAETKRYDLGVTTIFFLLDAQTALTNSQANLVTQSVQYRRNLLTLLRVTGQLLEERGVTVE
ncbi:MAG: TolC family protein [Acidobacteriia bacterium]|nr:TolC family protein [Terriglobia bacterium]